MLTVARQLLSSIRYANHFQRRLLVNFIRGSQGDLDVGRYVFWVEERPTQEQANKY